MERRQKTSGGNGRRLTLKEWLAKLMAVPLGRCLPEIALCMLVCCMLTGYIVLHLEQKEQYRQMLTAFSGVIQKKHRQRPEHPQSQGRTARRSQRGQQRGRSQRQGIKT